MTRKIFLATLPLLLVTTPATAQSWQWGGESRYERYRSYERPYRPPPRAYRQWRDYRSYSPYRPNVQDDWTRERRRDRRAARHQPALPKLMNGGPRPDIEPIGPQRIRFVSRHQPGTVIIDTRGRQLLLVEHNGRALRYPISVGREGFTWTGTEKISRIAAWPDWHPPAEMRQRDPRLPEKMTGGLNNPLGAKALYLGNTLYRIHGTNNAKSIGRAASSGCFRMLNGHVLDLADRVGVGTKVVVVKSLHSAEAPGPSGRNG